MLSPETSTPERLRIAMEMLHKTTSKVSEMAGQLTMIGPWVWSMIGSWWVVNHGVDQHLMLAYDR